MHGWSCQSQPQVQNNVTWHLSTVQFGFLTFHFLRGPTLVARSPDYYSFHVRSVCQWHIWKLSPTDCGHVAKSGTPALLTLQSCECEMMVYRWLACLPLQQWTGLLLSGVGGSSDQAIKCACFVLAAHPCQRLTAHAHSLLINSSQGNWPQASPDLGHFGSRSCLANCRYCCCWWCCSHLRATLTPHWVDTAGQPSASTRCCAMAYRDYPVYNPPAAECSACQLSAASHDGLCATATLATEYAWVILTNVIYRHFTDFQNVFCVSIIWSV